jgi:hypothetical protein
MYSEPRHKGSRHSIQAFAPLQFWPLCCRKRFCGLSTSNIT